MMLTCTGLHLHCNDEYKQWCHDSFALLQTCIHHYIASNNTRAQQAGLQIKLQLAAPSRFSALLLRVKHICSCDHQRQVDS